MQQLCPFEDVEGHLQAREPAHHIAPNHFLEERIVHQPEDASRALLLRIYAADYTPGTVLSISGADLVTRTAIEVTIEPDLLAAVRVRLRGLPHGWYEIFPSDHNVREGFHFPDPWGEPTDLLNQLAAALGVVVPPPVNHNKVSSRRLDRYALDEIHIDSFAGMRVTAGRRSLLWRYFINLGDSIRWTAIVPFEPTVIDVLLAVDYHVHYLDPVFCAADWQVPVLLVPTPLREQSRAHTLKLCTTHLLHSEYGDRGDPLAVVNSLT